MKWKIPAAILLFVVVAAAVSAVIYTSLTILVQPAPTGVTLDEILIKAAQAEPIGNNIWRTDDNERGVSCYRSAQSGGTLSCVKVK